MNRIIRVFAAAGAIALVAGCAWQQTDKCYVSMDRYRAIKKVYEQTGSMQRVEQRMTDEQWADCEKREVRYLLRKDLHLDEMPSSTE